MANGALQTRPLLTVQELAERWRMTPSAVYQLRHRGEAPAGCRIGRRVLFALEDVIAYEVNLRDLERAS